MFKMKSKILMTMVFAMVLVVPSLGMSIMPEDEVSYIYDDPQVSPSATYISEAEKDDDMEIVEMPSHDNECFDEVLQQYMQRGVAYTRPGDPRSLGCKCPSEGSNEIVCVELTCQRPPKPEVSYPKDMDFRNCYDPWSKQVYLNRQTYTRTQPMSEYQAITGNYSCSCFYGTSRCTATDIPCCDDQTGEFKDSGEEVSVVYGGQDMTCTCHRGKASFRDCRYKTPTAIVVSKKPSTNTGEFKVTYTISKAATKKKPEVDVNLPTDDCFDDVLQRNVRRGAAYVRPSNPRSLGCKCPSSGANQVVCEELRCQRLPKPQIPYPADMNFADCFDPYMNQVHPHGSTYTTTHAVSEYQSIEASYTCACNRGTWSCQASDIPCCDEITGEFKDGGEKVNKLYHGDEMTCTCNRGRAAYSNCVFKASVSSGVAAERTHTGPRITIQTGPLYGLQSGRETVSNTGIKCFDKMTGYSFSLGSSWSASDENGRYWNCACNVDGRGFARRSCSTNAPSN